MTTHPTGGKRETQPESKYRDFHEMPNDALCALANDLANPKEALRRIRSVRAALGAKS